MVWKASNSNDKFKSMLFFKVDKIPTFNFKKGEKHI